MDTVITDELGGLVAEQQHGERVGEDHRRLVDEEMSRASGGRGEGCLT
jgi:hypothetical protein